MIGVAASSATKTGILVAGIAGLVAGAMSMAVGEYVSVSSQRDAERADIEREKAELSSQPEAEFLELTEIYVKRGLERQLAMKVAEQLTAKDRLTAHLRDELGIDQASLARPWQAALISALSFASFALIPLVGLLIAPAALRLPSIAVFSLLSLAALGAFGAYLGGARLARAALRGHYRWCFGDGSDGSYWAPDRRFRRLKGQGMANDNTRGQRRCAPAQA